MNENEKIGAETAKPVILLVDDDEDFLMLMSRWLKRNYEVETATSGKEALMYLVENRPDLMLLDFEMPEMNGAETLTKIRETETGKDLPVFFLTGTEEDENVKQAESLNPEGFLQKSMGKAGLLMEIGAFFAKNS